MLPNDVATFKTGTTRLSLQAMQQQVTVLVLDEGLYEGTVFTAEQKLVSPAFTEISLTPKQIFAAEDL